VRPNLQGSARRALAFAAGVAAAAGVAHGCIARGDTEYRRHSDRDDGGPPITFIDAGKEPEDVALPPLDPHALRSVDPAHGAFAGGQRAILRGAGFTSELRVWFGETEVDPQDVLPLDPGRAQITVPEGRAGTVDVTTQIGEQASTRRTLHDGYTYEAFYVEPNSGPTSGGTQITLHGDATAWDLDTAVFIDGNPCPLIGEPSASELSCAAPPGSPGTKAVRVESSDGSSVEVLDAFTYANSDNGFRGGLSGAAIDGNLKVVVLDDFTGNGVPGASVIVGDVLDDALIDDTDAAGVASFSAPELAGPRTITIAKKCYQPVTFVEVPVDTVTVYLDPVLDLSCAEGLGELPPVGGNTVFGATVRGQLVWREVREFQRSGWTNVPPLQSDDERLVAYVLPLAADPTTVFRLPASYAAVTPAAGGDVGYEFRFTASPGNLSVYALAGIENRAVDPPLFIAYAMGIAKGIRADPGEGTDEVFLSVDIPLDHALSLDIQGPTPTPRGPDRVVASVSVRIGDLGHVLLPVGQRAELLPTTAPLTFTGIPPLTADLLGAEYVIGARAQTGPSDTLPRSVVGLRRTTLSGQVLAIDGFVEIPVLGAPASNARWDGRTLAFAETAGGAAVDLTLVEMQSGAGLVTWTIVAPGARKAITLPDLAALSGELGLLKGPIDIQVTAAKIPDFDYGSLRYRHLGQRGWEAHATDLFRAIY